MKVTLKRWDAIAIWKWDIPEDEVCGICRVQFDGTCPTCKFPGDDCALGKSTAAMYCLLYTIPNADCMFHSSGKMQPRISYGMVYPPQPRELNSHQIALFNGLDWLGGFQWLMSNVSSK